MYTLWTKDLTTNIWHPAAQSANVSFFRWMYNAAKAEFGVKNVTYRFDPEG